MEQAAVITGYYVVGGKIELAPTAPIPFKFGASTTVQGARSQMIEMIKYER